MECISFTCLVDSQRLSDIHRLGNGLNNSLRADRVEDGLDATGSIVGDRLFLGDGVSSNRLGSCVCCHSLRLQSCLRFGDSLGANSLVNRYRCWGLGHSLPMCFGNGAGAIESMMRAICLCWSVE